IRSGHVVDGLKLLDEAMVAVLDGRLASFMSGTLYCHTIAACHEVADIRRMTRWIELAERWLATFPAAVAFGGLCAVHRAQLHLFRGEWDEAERKALRVGADLDANRIDYAAEACVRSRPIARLSGEHVFAIRALAIKTTPLRCAQQPRPPYCAAPRVSALRGAAQRLQAWPGVGTLVRAGSMLWLNRNTLSGSYFALISASRP
ncbi:MAG: hypothetical protein ACRDJ2_03955, partial [Actinomycetota bacterium]